MAQTLSMNWTDYMIFSVMLIMSTGIGLYHGIKGRRNNTIDDYLFGGRNIPAITVIFSNMASTVSGVVTLLYPAETYYYGAQLIFTGVGEFAGNMILYYYFLPVFYHLKFTSFFEYLERRFNKLTRILVSVVYTISQLLYGLLIMYSCCMAINSAIPIPLYALNSFVCIVCAIYTAVGGLRGVVWSDAVQAFFIYVALLLTIVVTVYKVGGVKEVISIADKGGRLDLFNFNPSPFSRYSAWSLILSAGFFSIFNHCTSPAIMQRQLSLPNYKTTKFVAMVTAFAMISIEILSFLLGMVLYAAYHDCDPVLSKNLQHSDQLVSYHIMKLNNYIPGLTGIFLAEVLSAALSSVSTIMNSLSGIIFSDMIKPLIPLQWTNVQVNLCMKAIVIFIGLTLTAGMFALDKSTSGYQLFMTYMNLTLGFVVFIFGFGLFFRRANAKAALSGAIAGAIVTTWIGIGSQIAMASGKIQYITKIVSIEGCPGNLSQSLNVTTSGSVEQGSPVVFADDVPYMYRISFSLVVIVGIFVSLIVGLLVTVFTRSNHIVDESLLVPQVRKQLTEPSDVCDYQECKQVDTTTSR